MSRAVPFRPVLDVTHHPRVASVDFDDGPPAEIIVTLTDGGKRRASAPSRSSAAVMFMVLNPDLFPRAAYEVPLTEEEWAAHPNNTPEFFAEIKAIMDAPGPPVYRRVR